MPAGPATGRVEAERRALTTTTSTAPASRTRWCDASTWVRNRDASAGNTFAVPRRDSVRLASRILPANVASKDMHTGGAFVLHIHCTDTATRDTTNDGVNDPVSTTWGHAQGRTQGSFTPSLVHRLRHQHRR